MIKAQNHPAPHVEARILNCVNPLDRRAALADVLILLRFTKRFFVRAFDADEYGRDVGIDHQLQQFRIVGQIERRLGEECERITVDAAASR